MAEPDIKGGFDLPFSEQLEFFRQKLNLPTERWNDILREAHDRAFVVAGAMKADLLDDLRKAVEKAIATGTTLETFRKDFRKIVADRGWHGWTGEGTKAGENWRTKIIYETNLRSSHAAGRWQQLTDPELLKRRPYWRYIHNDSVLSPRPQHKAWGDAGLTLRYDHPFWQTHFPPNGWGCRCRVTAVAGPKDGDSTEPPDGWDVPDDKGRLPGIDAGWDYAPGRSVATSLMDLASQKLLKLDAPIGAAMWESMPPVLAREVAAGFAAWVDGVLAAGQSAKTYGTVGVMTLHEVDFYAALRGERPVTAEIVIEDRLIVGKKAKRHEAAGNALTTDEWKRLPGALASEREVYYDKTNGNLLYVVSALSDDRVVKLAVQVDFAVDRPKRTLNVARAGFKINANALQDTSRYQRME